MNDLSPVRVEQGMEEQGCKAICTHYLHALFHGHKWSQQDLSPRTKRQQLRSEKLQKLQSTQTKKGGRRGGGREEEDYDDSQNTQSNQSGTKRNYIPPFIQMDTDQGQKGKNKISRAWDDGGLYQHDWTTKPIDFFKIKYN